MIIIAIGIARSRTVQSWSEVSGKLWGKAILSEYDKYLLRDYGIMAFQSNDIDTISKYSSADNISYKALYENFTELISYNKHLNELIDTVCQI